MRKIVLFAPLLLFVAVSMTAEAAFPGPEPRPGIPVIRPPNIPPPTPISIRNKLCKIPLFRLQHPELCDQPFYPVWP